jgi:hypothetical protein
MEVGPFIAFFMVMFGQDLSARGMEFLSSI